MADETAIRILFPDGVCEAVASERVAEGRVRLLATPTASTTEARLGDVVSLEEIDGGVHRFVAIVELSPYETFSWPEPKSLAACGAFEDLLRRVEETGGVVERAFGGVSLVHVTKEQSAEILRRYGRIVASDAS
jgi:hypothetical protein